MAASSSSSTASRRVDGIVQQLCPRSTAGTNYADPTATRASWFNANLNTAALQHVLDYSNHAQRAAMKEFMKSDLFIPQYNISIDEERALALKRLQAICSQGFFSVRDFLTNPDKVSETSRCVGRAIRVATRWIP
jgi:hypothetical protein